MSEKIADASLLDFSDLPEHEKSSRLDLSPSSFKEMADLSDLAASLHRLLTDEHSADGIPALSCSVGIAVAPHDALTFDGLLSRASQACPAQGGVGFHDTTAGTRILLDSERLQQQQERARIKMQEVMRTLMNNVDA